VRFDRALQVVDAHAAGEPGRVVVGGVLDVPGSTMFDKMVHLREHGDELRLRLLREPRGYPAMCANVILPPTRPEADAGFVIMEQVEYPGMSGTNTICVVTVLLETGMLPMVEPVTELTLEAPAGLIRVRAVCRDGKVTRDLPEHARLAVHLDAPVEVPTLGRSPSTSPGGGMWYAIAEAERFGLRLTPDEGRDIVRITELVKAAAREQLPVVHPEQPGFAGVSIGQLSGPPHAAGSDRRNVVTVSTRERVWDRPATWTGVIDRSRAALGPARRWRRSGPGPRADQPFVHEDLGATFTGRLVRRRGSAHAAVVPELTGGVDHQDADILVDRPVPEFTVGDLGDRTATGPRRRSSRPLDVARGIRPVPAQRQRRPAGICAAKARTRQPGHGHARDDRVQRHDQRRAPRPLPDVATVVVDANAVLVQLGMGDGAERWMFERFGSGLGALARGLRDGRLRQWLTDGLVVIADDEPVELVEVAELAEGPRAGVAELLYHRRGVALAPLDERLPRRRIRRADIGTVTATPDRGASVSRRPGAWSSSSASARRPRATPHAGRPFETRP
jgi:proline racemase